MAIRRVLEIAGVEVRGQSAAEFLKWSKMGTKARAKQTAAANEAARGRVCSFEELCLKAKIREERPSNVSSYETKLRAMLLKRGIVCEPQKAIGPYNCDLAAAPVAVEIWGGGWHFGGHHMARTPKRFRYLFDNDWDILVIVLNHRFPLTTAVADYVAAYVQEARRNPSTVGQYRVIWGAGKFSVSGSAKDDEFSFIPPFTHRRNPATGQYETVPR